MKKLLFVTLTLLCVTFNLQAQFNYHQTLPQWFDLTRIDKLFWINTADTTGYPAASYRGAIMFRQQPGDTAHYASNGVKWVKMGTGATDLSAYFDSTTSKLRFAPIGRLINTTAPLQGGGSLGSDITLSVDAADGTISPGIVTTGDQDFGGIKNFLTRPRRAGFGIYDQGNDPPGSVFNITATGAQVLSEITTNTNGRVTWANTRTLTAGDLAAWDSTSVKANFPIDTVQDIPALQAYVGKAKLLFVKDTLRGRLFYWSATGTADNGLVFVGSTGYWARSYDGIINGRWFGLIGDNSTDNTTVLTALESSYLDRFYLPPGTYRTTLTSLTKYFTGPGIIRFNNGTLLYGNDGRERRQANGASSFQIIQHKEFNDIAPDIFAAGISSGGDPLQRNLIGYNEDRIELAGPGTSYTFPFTVVTGSDINVQKLDANRVRSLLTYTTDYTVTPGVGSTTVTTSVSLSSSEHLIIWNPKSHAVISGSGAHYSTINGGYDNITSRLMTQMAGAHNRVWGGDHNTIPGGSYAEIRGGTYNTISGGLENVLESTSGPGSVIAGGYRNYITGSSSNIGGGSSNKITSAFSSIVGGTGNSLTGSYTIGGGRGNSATQPYSVVFGFNNAVTKAGSSILTGQSGQNTMAGQVILNGQRASDGLPAGQTAVAILKQSTSSQSPVALATLDGTTAIQVVNTWGIELYATLKGGNTATGFISMKFEVSTNSGVARISNVVYDGVAIETGLTGSDITITANGDDTFTINLVPRADILVATSWIITLRITQLG